MKLGEGEQRDPLGRLYTYYQEDELEEFLGNAGFSIDEITTGLGRGLEGKMEPWIAFRTSK